MNAKLYHGIAISVIYRKINDCHIPSRSKGSLMVNFSLCANPDYRRLTNSARLALRELLELAWMDNEGCRVRYDVESLSYRMAWNEGELRPVLEEILADGSLAVEVLAGDLITREIEFPQLVKSAKESIAKRARLAARAGRAAENESRTSAAARLAAVKKGDSAPFDYIDANAPRDKYSGWVPTRGFIENGQAYLVGDAFLSELKSISGSISVEEELNRMFLYLMENPSRRPRLCSANQWIRSWIARSAEGELGVKTRDISTVCGKATVTSIDEAFGNV